jgi:hypothetical protein
MTEMVRAWLCVGGLRRVGVVKLLGPRGRAPRIQARTNAIRQGRSNGSTVAQIRLTCTKIVVGKPFAYRTVRTSSWNRASSSSASTARRFPGCRGERGDVGTEHFRTHPSSLGELLHDAGQNSQDSPPKVAPVSGPRTFLA